MITLKSFYLATTTGVDVINIGHDVRSLIREAKMETGWVNLTCRYPGAGLVVLSNDNRQAGLAREALKKELGDNGRAGTRHLLPTTLTLPLENGRPVFDPWQEIFLVDYDSGAKRREVIAQLVTEPKEQGQPARRR